MRLYELDADPMEQLNKLIVVTAQLKNDIDKGITYDWDVDTLLKYFRKYGVLIDTNDLYNMIQAKPLNSIIKNIQGDKIIFKGQQQSKLPDQPSDKDKDTVKKMAKKAMKKKP